MRLSHQSRERVLSKQETAEGYVSLLQATGNVLLWLVSRYHHGKWLLYLIFVLSLMFA